MPKEKRSRKSRRSTHGDTDNGVIGISKPLASGSSGEGVNWKIYPYVKFKRNSDRGDYRDTGILYTLDSKKHRQVQCWAEESRMKLMDPNEINATNAYFNFVVPKGKAYRPHEFDFIYIDYRVTVAEWVPAVDADTPGYYGVPTHMNADQEKTWMFYMNRSTFITDVISDVKVDLAGVNVVASGVKKQNEYGSYVHIERTLCSDSVYKERMGNVPPPLRLSTEFEQFTNATANKRSIVQQSCQIPLSFLNKNMRRIATGSIDGMFLLGHPASPVLKSIREKYGVRKDETDRQWIPPDTEIRISFSFEDPATLGHRLEIGGDNAVDKNYFSDTAATQPKFKAFVHIDNIRLNWETRSLTKEMNDIYNSGRVKLAYTYDAPYHISRKFSGGLSEVPASFEIRPGTEVAFICFKHAHQKNYMPNQLKHMSHRCVRPAMLESVELKLNDRPLFDQQKNFQDLRELQGPFNPSCINYYSTLVNKGLLPFPLETMFPAETTNTTSYCFIIVVDLSLHRMNSSQLLHIRCRYGGNELSPNNFDVDFFGVRQQHIMQAITTTDKGGVQMSVSGPFNA